MPQFDFALFPSQIFWLAIFFGLFWLIMARIGLPRVEQVLGERDDRISSDLEAAERMSADARQVEADYQRALADARAEAQRIANDTRDKVADSLAKAQADIDARIAGRIEEADAKLRDAKSQALSDLSDVATGVAGDLIAKLGVEASADRISGAVGNALPRGAE